MNDWKDLYNNQKDNPKLYRALIQYSEHFGVPFPMFMIGEATVKVIDQCIKNNKEYEPQPGLIY